MGNRASAQSGIEALARQAFQFIAPNKYNQLHLHLDGLKDPLDAEQTKRILFVNNREEKTGGQHA